MTSDSPASFATAIVESTPDGIAVHRDGKFLYVNPAFAAKFGIDRPVDIIGTDVYQFVHPDERPDLQARVQRILSTGERVPMRETVLLRTDGSEWMADLTGRLVTFEGEPAIASIARDITEKRQLAAQLMQMDRMIAAGTLAAGVGHEINNPLSYVTTNLDFARRRLQALSEAAPVPVAEHQLAPLAEALSDALHGCQRIDAIVSRLGNFLPDHRKTPTPTPLRPIIDDLLDMVANELPLNTTVEVVESPNLPPVMAIKNQLAQVFLNLLINAAHALDGEGEKNCIKVDLHAKNQRVIVAISDTGCGIDTDCRARIFDPFYTTKPVGEGTGLGLYIAQQIVDEHSGHISVDSDPDGGTTFRVELPAADHVGESL